MNTRILVAAPESLDGTGSGDHDLPYVFGRHPTVAAPFPFTTREFAHLLLVRSRLQSGGDPGLDQAALGEAFEEEI